MIEFEFNGLDMNKTGKLRYGEAIKFEFELKELDVSRAQRSEPLLLVCKYVFLPKKGDFTLFGQKMGHLS